MSKEKPLDLQRLRDRLDISHLVGSSPPSLPREQAIALIEEVESLRVEREETYQQAINAKRELTLLREWNAQLEKVAEHLRKDHFIAAREAVSKLDAGKSK
jgi:hypothetical protein